MTEMEWTHVTMGTPYAQGYSPNLVSPLSERRFYLQPATEEEERSSGKGLTEECPQLCLGECLQTQPSPSLKPPEEGSNKDGLHCVLLSPTLQAHLGANLCFIPVGGDRIGWKFPRNGYCSYSPLFQSHCSAMWTHYWPEETEPNVKLDNSSLRSAFTERLGLEAQQATWSGSEFLLTDPMSSPIFVP